MSEQVGLKLRLDVLRARLSQEHGHILSYMNVFAILRTFGMTQQDDVWILHNHADLAYIEKDEIEAIGMAVVDGNGRWIVELVPASATIHQIMTETVRRFEPPARVSSRLDGSAAASVCVPRAFVGTPRSVRQRGASLIRKVVKHNNWSVAHDPADMVRIADVSGNIYLSESIAAGSGNNVLLHMVLEAVCDSTAQDDRRQWYELQKQTVLSGLDHAWFCLAAMTSGPLVGCSPFADAEKFEVAREALGKILANWPILCALDSRIAGTLSRGWPCWCTRVAGLAYALGAPRATLELMRRSDVVTVGKILHNLLESTNGGQESG